MMRAALGYALAQDKLGLDRFAGKYAAKMAEGPDRRAFDILSSPDSGDSQEFREVARAVASTDTLQTFLREMRARYPDSGSFTADAQQPRAPAKGGPTARSGPAPARTAAR